jgi:hypothetical protein
MTDPAMNDPAMDHSATGERVEELDFHLRELRADLTLAAAALDAAAATPAFTPAAVRAWLQADVTLAHDLEVHLPAALALLGRTRRPVTTDQVAADQVVAHQVTANEAAPAPGDIDWVAVTATAGAVAEFTRNAARVLPDNHRSADDDTLARRLRELAGRVATARRLAAPALNAVLAEADRADPEPE